MTDFMDDIHRTLLQLPDRAHEYAAGVNRLSERSENQSLYYGRFCTVAFMLEVGEQPYHLFVQRGVLQSVEPGPLKMKSWAFAIRASEQCWRQFWSPLPKPGYNDIFAMASYDNARIDGDIGVLLKDLRFIKTLVALPRGYLTSQTSDSVQY